MTIRACPTGRDRPSTRRGFVSIYEYDSLCECIGLNANTYTVYYTRKSRQMSKTLVLLIGLTAKMLGWIFTM